MMGDLLAGVQAWGFAPADITMPVLILHGAEDRMVPSDRVALDSPG
jgi:pimeloyl-ACP methyl ester carboxylesterase